jgi:hypothetical protein
MNDQLKQYFEYLQKAGADVPPSFDSFKSTLSDEKEAQTYFNYLKTNKFDTPDTFDSFYSTFGFKKKDSPVSQTGAPNVGQPLQNTPQSQLPLGLVDDISMMPKADMLSLFKEKKAQVNEFKSEVNRFEKEGEPGDIRRSEAVDQFNTAVGDLNYIADTFKNIYGNDKELVDTTEDPRQKISNEFKIGLSGKKKQLYTEQGFLDAESRAIREVNDIYSAINTAPDYETAIKRTSDLRQQVFDVTAGDGDSREDLLSKLKYDALGLGKFLLKDANALKNTGGLTPIGKAGLDYLKIFNPERYESLLNRAKVVPETNEQRAGQQINNLEIETVGLSVLKTGVSDLFKNVQERINKGLISKDSQEVKNLNSWIQYISKAEDEQLNKYPEALSIRAQQTVNDVDKERLGFFGRSSYNLYKATGGAVEGLVNSLVKRFMGDEDKTRMDLESVSRDAFSYLGGVGQDAAVVNRDYLTVFSDKLKQELGKIDADTNLTDREKFAKKSEIVKNANSSEIYSVINPNKSKINLTAESFLGVLSTVVPQVLGGVATSYLTGGFGNISKARQLSNLFITSAATSYGQRYDQAMATGSADAEFNALAGAIIDGGTELIGNDIAQIKKVISGGVGGKILSKLSDADWNRIITSKSVRGGLLNAGIDLTKDVSEEVLGESLAQVGENIIKDNNPLEGVKETAISTLIGVGAFRAPFIPFTASKNNIATKYAFYSAGFNNNQTIKAIKDQVANGDLTEQEGSKRIEVVNKMNGIINTMPFFDKNGNPLSDDNKAKYAYNEYVKQEAKLSSINMPSKQAEELKQIAQKADEENGIILDGQELSKTESGMAVDKEGQLIEKKEQMKEKFGLKEEDFVGEAFTQEEDAADREALPESEFKTEEELINFLETGEYGMLTGQNPDAVPLSKDANRTLNERATKWLADRGLKAIPIFGKYGNSERSFLVPGLTKAQAIEFAKDFQQDSVAHSSGLVYRDGSFNPRSGKPFAQPMFNEGGDFFSTINVGGNIIDFAVPYDTDTKIQADKTVGDSINTALSNAVDTAAKSLEKAGIKFSIIDSSTDQSGAARGNQAVFVSETGEVIIDKSKLQDDIEAGIVVWHEASHPVMNILRNTNKDLYDSVVKGLTAAAKKDAGIGRTLGWAEDNYDGDSTKQDEALVEVVGRINAGIIDINNLDTGFRQKLIDFINGIAKYLGIDPILNDRDIAQFKKTVSEVADALKTGRDIAEIVGEENVKEYMNKIDSPEAVVGGVYTPQARVSENTLSVYDSKEVEKLPIRTLEDIHGAFGGRAVVINSDPTRVGELTLPSGKKIFMYGGPGYLSVKDNVDSNVGFATTQLSKVAGWIKYTAEVFGADTGVTMVATQAPTSILSNSYALRYVMDAISTLPKSVLRSSDFKNEFFGKDLVLLKDAFGEKAYNEFVSKYKKADLSDNKVIDDMISEMAYKVGDDNKPASFKARGAFVSNLLGGLAKKSEIKTVEGDTGYVSKKPQKFIAKQLMDRLGINAEKVIRDIGEPSLVDLYMNEGKWGMAVSGFESVEGLPQNIVDASNELAKDPENKAKWKALDDAAKEYASKFQKGGVKHPLFNAKFPGKNPFILDGAYEVDKIFKPVEMTGPSGEPYTKKAAQMLAGSMYVKGMPTEVDGTFEYTKSAPAGGAIQASAGNRIPEAKQKKLTDDGNGNYVFFHYSGKKLNKIDPSKFGSNLATGRDERPGVGISMFYVDNKTSEPGVPTNFGYAVRVPKENVYPINEDPLNFYDEAKAMFDKDFPGQAFDANKQVGYITKVANEKGFDMTVVDWNIKGKKALRAQTTESIKPEVYKKMEFKDGFEREVFTPELEKLKPGIQESVGGRTAEDFGKFGPENSKEFKTAAYVMRSKADGMNDTEIATGLLSVNPGMTPQEAKDIIDNPEAYIRSKFNYLSPALQENLINRARVVNIYAKSRTKSDPAFDSLEVRESSLDEAEIPKKGALKKWLGDFKRQWLDAAKGLPDWVLAIKDISGGVKDLQIRQATDMVKDLKKTAESIGFNDWDAFSKAMRSMKRDPEAMSIETGIQPWFANIPGKQLENAPAVIPAEIAALPEEIIPFVYSMRGMIDNLSSELVASGFVTPSQALTLTENLGEYVNRAYKLFNEKGYKPSKESIRDARKFLADKYIKQLATESAGMLTFEQIEKKAIDMANKDIEAIISKKLNPYFKKSDSRDTGVLKERKDIPAPIRKLMGEYTDPGTAFIITVAKQASLKAASQYLTGLRNNGMGSIFFEENDPERPVEFSVKISSEGSDSKSPLNGLYTTPDIAEALESVGPTFNDLTNVWMKLVGAVRWGKTVGSVVTQLKNFESNIGFAVMNGLIFSGENTQALKGAGKYFGGQVTGKKLDELTQKVMALGLVNQSVGTGELRKMLGSGDIHDIAVELAVTGKAKGAMNWIGKPFKAANKLYQLSDDFWKVYGYLNERELMSNALYNKKYDQLSVDEQTTVDLEASERVKMTQPTYDRVWAGAKYVSERAPIFGNFISFQAEIVRVLNNTIKIAARDMKSDNPKVKALGYKRFAGMVTYVGLRTVLTYAAAQAAGIGVAGLIGMFDDEEEKEKEAGLRKALPPFMRTGDLLAIPQKDPSKFTVFELSSIDPYGIVFKSMNALTEGREGIFGETMDPGVPAAMAEFFSGFLEQEMTFKTFNDLMNNSNPRTGEKIIKNDQTKSQAFLEAGKYVANQLKPSTIGLVERLMGKTPETELGSMFGARPYDVDLNRSFGRVMAQAGKDMEDVVKEYGRVRFDKELTPAERKEKIKAAEERLAYYANSLSETYRQFLLLGADKKQLDEMIKKRGQVKSTGFNKAFKKSILTGDINPETYFK